MGKAEDVAVFQKIADEAAGAISAGDLPRTMLAYPDDGYVGMPPNEPMLIGKEAIQSWFQNLFDQFFFRISYSIEDVEVVGDWAFTRMSYKATFTPKNGGESAELTGRLLCIYKRQPGGPWMVHWAIWNSDKPLPG